MAMELFGMDVAHYAAVSIVISFLILGHRSVFPSQKISMSKSDLLEIDYGEDIEHSSVSLTEENSKQFREIQRQIRLRRLKRANREKIEKKKEKRGVPKDS
jgi:hypothetical protein